MSLLESLSVSQTRLARPVSQTFAERPFGSAQWHRQCAPLRTKRRCSIVRETKRHGANDDRRAALVPSQVSSRPPFDGLAIVRADTTNRVSLAGRIYFLWKT